MIDHGDGLPDDRVTCLMCSHLTHRPRAHCKKYRMDVQAEVPLRCVGFDALPQAADQRNGPQRWPNMKAYIEEIRQIEADYAKRRGTT